LDNWDSSIEHTFLSCSFNPWTGKEQKKGNSSSSDSSKFCDMFIALFIFQFAKEKGILNCTRKKAIVYILIICYCVYNARGIHYAGVRKKCHYKCRSAGSERVWRNQYLVAWILDLSQGTTIITKMLPWMNQCIQP